MSHQLEAALENSLINSLQNLGYARFSGKDLFDNLKIQLEKHNKTQFNDAEFKTILNHLNKGNIFESAKTLRDKFALNRTDGSISYIEFMKTD